MPPKLPIPIYGNGLNHSCKTVKMDMMSYLESHANTCRNEVSGLERHSRIRF